MADFAPGDRVHVPRVGTGTIVEVRGGNRLVVLIKGKSMLVDGAQVEAAGPARSPTRKVPSPSATNAGREPHRGAGSKSTATPTSLDLHGKTVEEAIAALEEFLDHALIAGHGEVRIIHGRSGGRIRDAVHGRLRELPPVRSFRLDPRNPGVTIVSM